MSCALYSTYNQERCHGGRSEAVLSKSFCASQSLLCPENVYAAYFKHIIKQQYFPPKNAFCPSNLKTWLRAVIIACLGGHLVVTLIRLAEPTKFRETVR